MSVAHASSTALAFGLLAGDVTMTRLAPSALDSTGTMVEGAVVYQPKLVRATHTLSSRGGEEGQLIGTWQNLICVPAVP